MRIVPVLDLKGGVVVHARRGERDAYAPLESPLVAGSEPVAVAQALCAVCRTSSLYVADLDALAGGPADVATLTALAAVADPWVDAGATTPERATQLARAGVARNVVGTESLGPDHVDGDRDDSGEADGEASGSTTPRRVLSIDLRDGQLISPRRELTGREAAAAAPLAVALGVREVLVIDLARVGSGSGPPLHAVEQLADALPGVAIYAGGGVRHDEDLHALESAGASGALVATALHEGRITLR